MCIQVCIQVCICELVRYIYGIPWYRCKYGHIRHIKGEIYDCNTPLPPATTVVVVAVRLTTRGAAPKAATQVREHSK